MNSYDFLLDIAVILLSTKVLGLVTKRFHMPQVVGALLAGLLLGPAVLNVLKGTEFLHQLSELGVIVLMFGAGVDADLKELRCAGKASLVIAIIGVVVPLAGGVGVAYFFNRPGIIDSTANASLMLQNIFIGIILTATSVSITVESLKEMGKLNSRAGSAILGAAIIDDILGIIGLTIVTSLADSSVNVVIVLLKVAAFFIICIPVGYLYYIGFKKWRQRYSHDMRRFAILAFVFCLLLSYAAEHFFGVADITGAFLAGLIISNTPSADYVAVKFDGIAFLFLSPVFFASIGLQVELPTMSASIIMFAVTLVVIACLTKIIGCGAGAKICGFSNRESVQIGVGMVSRGEVALIVANKGAALGLMSADVFGPVVIVVIFTTIITPILLKMAFYTKENKQAVPVKKAVHP